MTDSIILDVILVALVTTVSGYVVRDKRLRAQRDQKKILEATTEPTAQAGYWCTRCGREHISKTIANFHADWDAALKNQTLPIPEQDDTKGPFRMPAVIKPFEREYPPFEDGEG